MELLKYFKELSLHPANAKELKGLILQLAVQGKLTAQWRNSHPEPVEGANVLLEKIKAEKDQLIKEKKIKKEKPLPPITQEEIPHELPIGWEWCRVGDLLTIKGGKRVPKGHTLQDIPTEHVYIRVTDMKNGTVNLDNLKYISNEVFEIIKTYTISKNDLYITIAGTIGDIGEIPEELDNMNLTENAAKLMFTNIDKIYLKYSLKSELCQKQFVGKVNQMAQPKLALHRIASTLIPLPPLAEQKAIVSIVEKLFAEVEQLEQLTQHRIQIKQDFATSALQQLNNGNTQKEWAFLQAHFHDFFNHAPNIKKLRESILQLAVQGKLTAHWRTERTLSGVEVEAASILLEKTKAEKAQLIKAGKIKKEKPLPPITQEEIPYELPKGWVWCRLEDLMSITGGVTKGKKYKGEIINSPYLRVANVQRGFLDLNIMKDILISHDDYRKYQLKRNDLLMIEGGDPDKVGRCAIWNNEIEGCIYQNHVFRVRSYKNGDLNNFYLMQFINSPITRIYYESCAKRTTNLASINKTQMRSTPIALPPLNEQKAIVQKVNNLMALCDSLEQEVNQNQVNIEQWMKSVLREVVR
jgi:type I restriction enzyme, S subunit